MYLHLGNDKAIISEDIIGIFDMDNTTVSTKTRKFLTMAQKNNDIKDVSEDLPKSFIVAGNGKKTSVYISSVATRTLIKRVGTENFNL